MYVQTVQTVQTYGPMEQRLKGWCWAVSGFWNSKKGTSLCKHAGACMKMSREFKSGSIKSLFGRISKHRATHTNS